jgi:lactate dehydrogenase-like 2-hydroxyacid dehydrogenase
MQEESKPTVLHVGPVREVCAGRYAPHFTVHPIAAGAIPEAALAAGVQALIAAAPVPAALIAALPRLRLIAAFGVGVDRIDLAAARARGIAVTNSPGVSDGCVADMAFALLLAAARHVVAEDRFLRAGKWPAQTLPLIPRLHHRRMGILGLGHIGRAIARRAEGFDMHISYHNRRRVPALPYAYKESVTALAEDADILVIACLGGAATRNLVDASVLRALGPRGILVNIARGSIVDEAALIEALESGGIAAAGLDVFAHEPNVPARLMPLDNVVLTPHRAGSTIETWRDCADNVVANLCAFYAGEPLPTPIDLPPSPPAGRRGPG